MVDTETDHIEKIKSIIGKHHPEADFEGIETHLFA